MNSKRIRISILLTFGVIMAALGIIGTFLFLIENFNIPEIAAIISLTTFLYTLIYYKVSNKF